MKDIVCFGEMLVRLSTDGYLRFPQAERFNVSYTGAEGNVAVALSNFGLSSAIVTKLPENDISRCVVRTLKSYGVNTSNIIYGGDRIGLYYLEKGASQRPSKIIYDRKHSALSEAQTDEFNWDNIFSNAQWFHFSGITAGLSKSAAVLCKTACQKAKALGIKVSCDLNYRRALWSKEQARQVMIPLMEYVDVLFANEEDSQDALGISAEDSDIEHGIISDEGYSALARKLQTSFGFEKVVISLWKSLSASDNGWSGLLFTDGKLYKSREYKIHLVDRVGGGDSFASGMIYAIITGMGNQESIEFAAAASCLKQTIEYDYNLSSVEEIQILANGGSSGRVIR